MAIQVKGKQYENFLNYLQREHPKFYREFNEQYHAKRHVHPDMTREQYLLHISEKLGKRAKAKIKSVDASLIAKEELEELTKLLKKNQRVRGSMKKYVAITQVAPYITPQDRETLEKEAVGRVYDSMDEKDRRRYGNNTLLVIIPKLNIGPWSHHGRGNQSSIENIIDQNPDIFEAHEDIAVKLLERAYDKELQSEKDNTSYLEKLRKL